MLSSESADLRSVIFLKRVSFFSTLTEVYLASGGSGGARTSPRNLADQLNLVKQQGGGADYAPHITPSPPSSGFKKLSTPLIKAITLISCGSIYHELRTHDDYTPNSLRPKFKFKYQSQINIWDLDIKA